MFWYKEIFLRLRIHWRISVPYLGPFWSPRLLVLCMRVCLCLHVCRGPGGSGLFGLLRTLPLFLSMCRYDYFRFPCDIKHQIFRCPSHLPTSNRYSQWEQPQQELTWCCIQLKQKPKNKEFPRMDAKRNIKWTRQIEDQLVEIWHYKCYFTIFWKMFWMFFILKG